MDDVYVDTTWARVEIGNSANYGECTHREIQIPISWSDESVKIRFNQESFEIGDRAYIFVVDENGRVSEGFPITIGNSVDEFGLIYIPLATLIAVAVVSALRKIGEKRS